MKILKSKSIIVMMLFSVVAIVACLKKQSVILKTSTTCDSTKAYYVNDIEPIISSKCASGGCHNGNDFAASLNLNNVRALQSISRNTSGSYDENVTLIKVISEKGENKMPPASSAQLTDNEIALLKLWAKQGAWYNSCTSSTSTSGCDTSSVTYSGFIATTMTNNCAMSGCHDAVTKASGVDLSSYSGVKAANTAGILMPSINQTGSKPMPLGGNKLDDCTISKINAWINAGVLNN